MPFALQAKNLTAGVIVLDDLGVTVQPHGEADLSDLRSDEIMGSPRLQEEVLAGNVKLCVGDRDIEGADSAAWFSGDFGGIERLGSVTGGTLYSEKMASTTQAKFVDVFGESVSVAKAGGYMVVFEGLFGASANMMVGIAVGINSEAAPESERVFQVSRNPMPAQVTFYRPALEVGDTVHALCRRASGKGSVWAAARRLTIWELRT